MNASNSDILEASVVYIALINIPPEYYSRALKLRLLNRSLVADYLLPPATSKLKSVFALRTFAAQSMEELNPSEVRVCLVSHFLPLYF
jgi:hypothetical protein